MNAAELPKFPEQYAGADDLALLDDLDLSMGSKTTQECESAASTVLVVDDDLPTRRLAGAWLEHGGFRVQLADSGQSCLDLAQAEPERFSAIVLDVMMPGMDGFMVVQRLQSNARTAAIPVLLLTAHANDEEAVLQGIESGAAHHLAKPYSGAILVARVRALCDQRNELRAVQAQLEHAESLAATDALTGLANRRSFEIALAREIAYARRHREALGLLALDIDRFKSINDRFGHPLGDRVIRQLADVLQATLRASDGAFRVGGEEFAVLLRGAGLAAARVAAEHLHDAVRRSPTVLDDGRELAFTCSIGVAALDAESMFDGDGLVQRADDALYRAKREGRDRVCSEP